MSRIIVGLELRNVEFEGGEYRTQYVDRDSLEFFYPKADLTTERGFFDAVCLYLEDHDDGVVSCGEAKINEFYMADESV